MLAVLFISVFAALLLWAAIADLRTMEIPNRISLLIVGLYPIAAFACGIAWQDILIHIGVGFAAFVVCWGLFLLRVFGGGDAKVIAAATVWTGLAALSQFLLWTCIAGGGLAALAIVTRKRFKPAPALPGFVNTFLGETHLPYAVAIAAGGLSAITRLPIFLAAA